MLYGYRCMPGRIFVWLAASQLSFLSLALTFQYIFLFHVPLPYTQDSDFQGYFLSPAGMTWRGYTPIYVPEFFSSSVASIAHVEILNRRLLVHTSGHRLTQSTISYVIGEGMMTDCATNWCCVQFFTWTMLHVRVMTDCVHWHSTALPAVLRAVRCVMQNNSGDRKGQTYNTHLALPWI